MELNTIPYDKIRKTMGPESTERPFCMEKIPSSRTPSSRTDTTSASASNLPVYAYHKIGLMSCTRFVGSVVSYKKTTGEGIVRWISCDVDDELARTIADEDDATAKRDAIKHLTLDERKSNFDASMLINANSARRNDLVVMEVGNADTPTVDLIWIVAPPNGLPSSVSKSVIDIEKYMAMRIDGNALIATRFFGSASEVSEAGAQPPIPDDCSAGQDPDREEPQSIAAHADTGSVVQLASNDDAASASLASSTEPSTLSNGDSTTTSDASSNVLSTEASDADGCGRVAPSPILAASPASSTQQPSSLSTFVSLMRHADVEEEAHGGRDEKEKMFQILADLIPRVIDMERKTAEERGRHEELRQRIDALERQLAAATLRETLLKTKLNKVSDHVTELVEAISFVVDVEKAVDTMKASLLNGRDPQRWADIYDYMSAFIGLDDTDGAPKYPTSRNAKEQARGDRDALNASIVLRTKMLSLKDFLVASP